MALLPLGPHFVDPCRVTAICAGIDGRVTCHLGATGTFVPAPTDPLEASELRAQISAIVAASNEHRIESATPDLRFSVDVRAMTSYTHSRLAHRASSRPSPDTPSGTRAIRSADDGPPVRGCPASSDPPRAPPARSAAVPPH